MISDYTCLAINDTKLLIYNVIFIFLQLLVTGAGVLLVTTYLNKDSKKQRVIRKKLIEKAKTDPYAKKKLDKMERKRKKSIKQEWIEKALMLAIIIICVVVNLFWCIIPGLTDYIKKDYVVYSGEFSVNLSYSPKFRKTYSIVLEDGTHLTGSLGLEEGEHNKTIVYSKRTEIALDIID